MGENAPSFLPNNLFPQENLVGNGEFREQTKYPDYSSMAQSAKQVISFKQDTNKSTCMVSVVSHQSFCCELENGFQQK